MEEKFENQSSICVCGKKHSFSAEQVVVDKKAFDCMIDFVCKKKYAKVLLIDDEKGQKEIDFVCAMRANNIDVEVLTLKNCRATEFEAKNIDACGKDIIVAIGKERLISVAKYCACEFDLNIIAFPCDDFVDFTFSSFARLYDGVQFCFYKTVSPVAVFVEPSQKLNGYQIYYLSSKFLAFFDNEFARLIFKNDCCPKMAEFFKKTMNEYSSADNTNIIEKTIWTLIRLGFAMTFFDQTKYFFGGDKLVCDCLQAFRIDGNFLELETIALKLIINTYGCFLRNSKTYSVTNLNKHMKLIGKLYKIPATEIIKRMGNNDILLPSKQTRNTFLNYQPYLKNLFDKMLARVFKIHTELYLTENITEKYNLNGTLIEQVFAVSANFSKKPTLLGFVQAYGFMDKLIE